MRRDRLLKIPIFYNGKYKQRLMFVNIKRLVLVKKSSFKILELKLEHEKISQITLALELEDKF